MFTTANDQCLSRKKTRPGWQHQLKLFLKKLFVFFILFGLMQMSAKANGQTVTIFAKDASLEKVFSEIKKQTGFDFWYESKLLKKSKKVTINARNEKLETVLDQCFQGQPLRYSIVERTIVVSAKDAPPQVNLNPALANNFQISWIDIHGKVIDENGKPAAGVAVHVKGTAIGTITDENGEFRINGVDPKAVLIFEAVNMDTYTYALRGDKDITVVMKHKVSSLDEIQIGAYKNTSKRFQTGSVTTIKSDAIEKQPTTNPLLTLSGKVPGLFITQQTGLANTGVQINIDGQNSIFNGNDPLYVIDGVPVSSQMMPSASYILYKSGGNSNPLNFINPSDIESIEVLKDAAATSIYGSRAANGAILITTKKGVAGRMKVNFLLENGWGKVTRTLPLMDSKQYLDMRHEAFRNDNRRVGDYDYDLNGYWDSTRYTNWQKVLLGNTAKFQKANLSISGGNEEIQYMVAGSFNKQTTVLPADFNDQKISLSFNLNSTSHNKKFKMQLSGNYMYDYNQLPTDDPTYLAYQLGPTAPAMYNSDGSINWMIDTINGGATFYDNPAKFFLNKDLNKTYNLISRALLSYQVMPGLELKSNFGFTNLQVNDMALYPIKAINPDDLAYSQNSATYVNNNSRSWIIEPQIAYHKNIGTNRFSALLGSSFQQLNNSGIAISGQGYASDDFLENVNAAASVSTKVNGSSLYKYNAAFGNLNYIYANKYIVDFSARRDGSSRFGTENLFHNFWGASVGWIFSGEKFVRNNLGFLNYGKLTFSYGTTGNDQIGDYRFMPLYNPITYNVNPYQGVTGMLPASLSNPFLQWEETQKTYASLMLGFLKDRIIINAGYSNNQSSNQLLSYPLPVTTGFNSIIGNLPAKVNNRNLEFSLQTVNIKKSNFKWTTDFNITFAKNKLVAFPDLENSYYANALEIGKPISIIKVFQLNGVDSARGVYQFMGKNDQLTSYPQFVTDFISSEEVTPKYYGGIENSFSYKQFQLSFLLQFVKQNGRNYALGTAPGIFNVNQPVWVLDRWQKAGDIATIQRFNSNYSIAYPAYLARAQSTGGFGDASFIRLRNVSFSWMMPESILNNGPIQNLRLFMNAQNLWTFTKYKGLDPESQMNNSVPPLRVITIGLALGL